MGWTEAVLAFLPYGKTFQETRKIFQQQLSRKGCVIFQECQTRQASIHQEKREEQMWSYATGFAQIEC